MTDDDFSIIERELEVQLPSEYRAAMADPPLIEDNEQLWYTPARVIDGNRRLRQVYHHGHAWPEHYLAIGDDVAGSYYFIDLAIPSSPVFIADHGKPHHVLCSSRSIFEFAVSLAHAVLVDDDSANLIARSDVLEAAREFHEPSAEALRRVTPSVDRSWHPHAYNIELLKKRREFTFAVLMTLAALAFIIACILWSWSGWLLALAILLLIAMSLSVTGVAKELAQLRRELQESGGLTKR